MRQPWWERAIAGVKFHTVDSWSRHLSFTDWNESKEQYRLFLLAIRMNIVDMDRFVGLEPSEIARNSRNRNNPHTIIFFRFLWHFHQYPLAQISPQPWPSDPAMRRKPLAKAIVEGVGFLIIFRHAQIYPNITLVVTYRHSFKNAYESPPMASTQCMQIRWLSQKSETCLLWAKNVAGLWATIRLDNFAGCSKTPVSGISVFQKMSPFYFDQHFWIQNTNVSWCFFIHFVPSSRGTFRGTRGARWEETLLALRALPRPPSHWDGWRLARLEPMEKRDHGKMEEDLGDEKLETKSQSFFDRTLLW